MAKSLEISKCAENEKTFLPLNRLRHYIDNRTGSALAKPNVRIQDQSLDSPKLERWSVDTATVDDPIKDFMAKLLQSPAEAARRQCRLK